MCTGHLGQIRFWSGLTPACTVFQVHNCPQYPRPQMWERIVYSGIPGAGLPIPGVKTELTAPASFPLVTQPALGFGSGPPLFACCPPVSGFPPRQKGQRQLVRAPVLTRLGRGTYAADTFGMCRECLHQKRPPRNCYSLGQGLCFPRGIGRAQIPR